MDIKLPKLSTSKVHISSQKSEVTKFWKLCRERIATLYYKVRNIAKLEITSESSKRSYITQLIHITDMLNHLKGLESEWNRLNLIEPFPELRYKKNIELKYLEIIDLIKDSFYDEIDEDYKISIEQIVKDFKDTQVKEKSRRKMTKKTDIKKDHWILRYLSGNDEISELSNTSEDSDDSKELNRIERKNKRKVNHHRRRKTSWIFPEALKKSIEKTTDFDLNKNLLEFVPQYDGKLETFPHFISQFLSLIDSTNWPDSIKLESLRQKLDDKASLLIKNYFAYDYKRALKVLMKEYMNESTMLLYIKKLVRETKELQDTVDIECFSQLISVVESIDNMIEQFKLDRTFTNEVLNSLRYKFPPRTVYLPSTT